MIDTIFPRDSDRYTPTDEAIHAFYQLAIERAVKELLEKKHLYQYVEAE